jgi:DNA-binding NarL/FixJ family response regulator
MTTQVLIVEDEPEFLQRFSQAVLADAKLRLLAAVSSGAAAQAVMRSQPFDVLMVDLGLPDMDGVDLIREAVVRQPGCDVLVVTMFGDDGHVLSSIEAGATGYLLKDAMPREIAACVHELRAGGSPISPSIARRVLERFQQRVPLSSTPPAGPRSDGVQLSEREIEILKLVAKGLAFQQVGEVLGISPHTVVAHVKKIYRKLAVHSRGEAVYEAGQLGLL